MHKIVTLLGSPRKKGNTAKVLKAFEENIAVDHEVVRVNIAEMNINGCLGCHACQNEEDLPGCVQKDDVEVLFQEISKRI